MSFEKEHNPIRQAELLYATPGIELPLQADTLLMKLKEDNKIVTNTDLLIVDNKEVIYPRYVNHSTGEKKPVIRGAYGIYDAKSGLPNYYALYERHDDKILVEQAVIFEQHAKSNSNNLENPFIDTVVTTIKKAPSVNAEDWEAKVKIYRTEHDNLRLRMDTQKTCYDEDASFPTEKEALKEMKRIKEQVSIIAGNENKVFLRINPYSTPR